MALDFAAGCIGGAAGVTVGQPFDTVKVRLQMQHGSSATNMYKGVIDCVVKMIKQESITGLYKGLTPPIIGLGFQNALIFGFQAQFRNLFEETVTGEMKAGAATGLVQAGVTAPIELAKIRLQVQGTGEALALDQRKYKGPVQTLLKIQQEEGLVACFRGLGGVIMRDIPATAIYFGTFAYLNSMFIPEDGNIDSLHPGHLLLTGGCAGVTSWAMLHPVDVLKTRIQAEGIGPTGKYTSYYDCVSKSFRHEGVTWLVRGFGATVLRAFPVNAAILSTYTLVVRFFKPKEDKS